MDTVGIDRPPTSSCPPPARVDVAMKGNQQVDYIDEKERDLFVPHDQV